jgi:hypothetical protein
MEVVVLMWALLHIIQGVTLIRWTTLLNDTLIRLNHIFLLHLLFTLL